MADKIESLTRARKKKGWTQKEIKEFANRRSKELKEISPNVDEPDYYASGIQKRIEDICDDGKED
ncbi:hypothetical protein [Sessilibacter corallicola]|uniref:hypothetical protein n=1 Tax=Sessilibacter corallicola TaxID=2904075 RepID=UPI001E4AAD2B|nr:hypothetical protein [Sessilibacter corallicola]MCE2028148.1 hypothetical protein [Sessilibacter corallicola]